MTETHYEARMTNNDEDGDGLQHTNLEIPRLVCPKAYLINKNGETLQICTATRKVSRNQVNANYNNQ